MVKIRHLGRALLGLAALFAFSTGAKAQVTDLSSITDDATYTLKASTRGYLAQYASDTNVFLMGFGGSDSGSKNESLAVSGTNTFALIKSNGYSTDDAPAFYIFNVSTSKFLSINTVSTGLTGSWGNSVSSSTLSDTPDQCFRIRSVEDPYTATTNDAGTWFFTTVPLKSDGYCNVLNIGGDGQITIDDWGPKSLTNNSWGSLDGGNQFTITITETKLDETTLATAQAAIETYELDELYSYSTNLAHLQAYVSNNTGATGVSALSTTITNNTVADTDTWAQKVAKAQALQTALTGLLADSSLPTKVLTTSDDLPGTSDGSQYSWTSGVINVGGDAGKLRFTVSTTNTSAASNGHVFFTLSEFYLYDADGNEVTLSTDNFSTNAQELTGEGDNKGWLNQGVLTDRDKTTYFHSAYNNAPSEDHYIEITLPAAMSSFKFGFVSRNGNNVPTTITVTPTSFSDMKTALSTATTSAATTTSSYTFGDALNEYSDPNNAFQTALKAAQGISDNATPVEVQTAQDNLATALAAVSINMPTNGSFIRIQSTAQNTYLYGTKYGDTKLNMGSDGTGSESIFYYTTDGTTGKLLSYQTGYYVMCAASSGQVTLASVSDTPGEFTIAASSTANNYTIKYSAKDGNKDRYLYAYSDRTDCTTDFAVQNNFKLSYVESLPVTIGASGYATFYTPVTLTVGDNTVYTGSQSEDNKSVVLKTVSDIIPANTAVLVAGTSGDVKSFAISSEEGKAIEGNILKGQIASIAASTVTTPYTLQTINGESGFAKYTGTELKGFKCYIENPTVATDAPTLAISFEDATGINAINAATENGKATIYDLQGRRVQNAARGLYIVNGQKVLVK